MEDKKRFYKFLRDCFNGNIEPSTIPAINLQELNEKDLDSIFMEDVLYYALYDPYTESLTEGQGTMTNWQR